MTSPKSIKKKAENKYLPVVKALLAGQTPFPLVLKGTGISLHIPFKERMEGIKALEVRMKKPGKPGYTLELSQRATRQEGPQSYLRSVSFKSREDYFHYLGKVAEVNALEQDFRKIKSKLPELSKWCEKSAKQIINRHNSWDDLINILLYFRDRETLGLYLREVPLQLPTKFIESNESFLRELLDLVLNEERINRDQMDISLRYGLEKDQDFRFRIMTDPGEKDLIPFRDLAVLPKELAMWNPRSGTVLIFENKISFLRFPERKGIIKIWGSGRSVSLLRDCLWLSEKDVYYWGDLDPHGFEILSQLRECFPNCHSICMDEETFVRFKKYTVPSSPFFPQNNLLLSEEEMTCYRNLISIEKGRLEQERLPLDFVTECFDFLLEKKSHCVMDQDS